MEMHSSEDGVSSNNAFLELQPGQSIKPNITMNMAKALILEHFGYEVSKIKELNSYDDNNFMVEGTNFEGNHGKFIFKVLNSMDSRKSGHIEAEQNAMLELSKQGVKCPVPQRSKTGQLFVAVRLAEEHDVENNVTTEAEKSINIIRLLSFVEGKIMYDVHPTPRLLIQAGEYIAKIEKLLSKCKHEALTHFSSIWMLGSAPRILEFVYVIKDQERYAMVTDVIQAYEQRVIPALPNLEKGILHGDYNEQNVLVTPSSAIEGEYDIDGIIDFGDMQESYYVFELAITLCYMMIECIRNGEIHPLEGARYVLKGYCGIRSIPQNEMELLRVLIACRLCQSVVMGAYSHSQNPDNDYTLTTSKTGWTLLNQLWNEVTDNQLIELCKNQNVVQ